MRLLITGGAGTLGAAIVDRILERGGTQILALDNLEAPPQTQGGH
jgi:nucleoside-diphosphate-sugar epimerase